MATEVVAVVVSALTAGAAAGVKDTATAAVKDAYAGLLAALQRRFGRAKAEELHALAETHTGGEGTGRGQLVEALNGFDVTDTDELVVAARALLAQLDPAGTRAGKYTVDARDAQGVQIGDGNVQTNRFDGSRR